MTKTNPSLIPKIIHYVWLGGNDESILPYLATWKKHNPSYKFMLWNEKNIDFSISYLKTARRYKNWANVSNLVRLLALKKYGGIYLDTDVRVQKSLDPLRYNKCFFGFQTEEQISDWVNNAVCGAVKNHWFINKLIRHLVNHFDGTEAANDSSPTMTTTLLVIEGLKKYSTRGVTLKDIHLYPQKSFYPYKWNESSNVKIGPSTYTVHEWKKRWEWHPQPKTTKLVMTLLVRDEADIVERNICFHLSRGVDHIIAMDNNSIDNTARILHKYAKLGVLTYLPQKNNTYEQSKWVSQMARLAVSKHKATHLFHCDADEFWFPDTGNLKDNLPSGNQVFYIPVANYLPITYSHILSPRHMVANPISCVAQINQALSYRFLLYRYPPKIITTDIFTEIIQGNHDVASSEVKTAVYPTSILIHHFPIRSYSQFRRKVQNGGHSYLHHPNQDPEIGWQWKEWYRLFQAGLLWNVYKSICLTGHERQILRYRGLLQLTRVPNSIRFAKQLYWLSRFKSKKI